MEGRAGKRNQKDLKGENGKNNDYKSCVSSYSV